MPLRGLIALFEQALTAHYQFDLNSKITRINFGLTLASLAADINKNIKDYIDHLDGGECLEVLGLNFEKFVKKDYWMKGYRQSCCNVPLEPIALDELGMTYSIGERCIKSTTDINNLIVERIMEMTSLLKEARKKTMSAPKGLFGNFYRNLVDEQDKEPVVTEYEEWIMRTENLSFDSLKEYQTLIVAEFLKRDILRYTTMPSKKALEQVRLDKVLDYLPYGYELPSDFDTRCARFRRFISWDDDILQINYDAYGKYLFQHYYQLSEQERIEMIRLDLLLRMIHKNMAQLRPELAAYLKANNVADNGKNYFAVGKNLSVMLEGDWFKTLRTDKKYDNEWIIKFVTALLKSEHRDTIAWEWSKPERRLMLKGAIVGCIKEAGVIAGSDLSIAKAIIEGTDTENKTFAIYMGKGKKRDFYDWIMKYLEA